MAKKKSAEDKRDENLIADKSIIVEENSLVEKNAIVENTPTGEAKTRLEAGGELTIYVAAELKEKIGALFSGDVPIEIDLSEVSEIDSAGLQLLLLAQREAAKQQKSVVFHNPSTAVLNCWRLCNVSALFGAESAAAP